MVLQSPTGDQWKPQSTGCMKECPSRRYFLIRHKIFHNENNQPLESSPQWSGGFPIGWRWACLA